MPKSSWNRSQQIALAVTPKISSMFSLAGSTWIILEVLLSSSNRGSSGGSDHQHQKRLHHPYHRLLLAMSIYDAFESIWNFMSTWPIPEGEELWAIGTTRTCTTQGFFLTLSVAVPIYNAFLALYYMLVVNHNVRDRTLRRVVEPVMHVTAAFWAFGTAFSSVGLDLLNDANLWCWIAPYPSDCLDSRRYGEEGNCERGDNAWIYRWAFYFAPLWFCIFVATICTYRVYKRVNSLDRRTLKFRRPDSERIDRCGRRSSRFVFDGDNSFANSSFSDSSVDHNNAMMSSVRGSRINDKNTINNNNKMASGRRMHLEDDQPSSFRSIESGAAEDDHERGGFDLAAQEKQDDLFLSGRREEYEEEISHVPNMNLIDRWKSRRAIYHEDYPRSVEVMHQALWYLGAFYLTHVWSTSNRIVQFLNQGSTSFGLILVHSWFDPFQGFLNYLVYQRPRYLRIRKFCPALSRWEACKRALLFSYSPPSQPEVSRRGAVISAASPKFSPKQRKEAVEGKASSMPSIVEDEETRAEDKVIRKDALTLSLDSREADNVAACNEPGTGTTEDTGCSEIDFGVVEIKEFSGVDLDKSNRPHPGLEGSCPSRTPKDRI